MGNILFIDKPKGITSFDVCYRLRRVLGTKKIGHTGTLDPNATGVMIVLFDKATKANQFLVSDNKEYICEVKFGIETDTLDIDGNIINRQDFVMPDNKTISDVLLSFKGESKQVVPITSAVSVNGKRLYQYQRENIEVELPERIINIEEIELLNILDDGFSFRCKVSSGTYIRSLVKDICNKLGVIGTVNELRRTKIDNVNVEECDSLEDIEKGNYKTHDLYSLLSRRYKVIEYENIEDIYNGKRIKLDLNEERVLISKDNEAIAIYEKDGDTYKSIRGLW